MRASPRYLLSFLFFCSIATLPLYLWSSGLPQLTHVLLLIFALFLFFGYSKKISFKPHELLILGLMLFALFRECVAIIGGSGAGGLSEVAYLAFNLVVLVSVRSCLETQNGMAPLKWGYITALLLAVAGLWIMGTSFTGTQVTERAIGTFNNPNQLGYFSVCSFCLFVIFFKYRMLNAIQSIVIIGLIGVLSVSSLSKAANIAIGLGVVFLLLSTLFSRSNWSFKILTLVALLAIMFIFAGSYLELDDLLITQRLRSIGSDSDDSLEERGTFALFDAGANVLEYLFGIGYGRSFAIVGHEIHSTLAANLVNYGFFGGGIYLLFLGYWAWKSWKKYGIWLGSAMVLPPMVYGIAHNGTRFTVFYVAIAASLASISRHYAQSGKTTAEKSVNS